jgi:hypothetical protein
LRGAREATSLSSWGTGAGFSIDIPGMCSDICIAGGCPFWAKSGAAHSHSTGANLLDIVFSLVRKCSAREHFSQYREPLNNGYVQLSLAESCVDFCGFDLHVLRKMQ